MSKKSKEKEENFKTLNLFNILYEERVKPIPPPRRKRPIYETDSGHKYHIIDERRGMFFRQISDMFGFKGKKGVNRIQQLFRTLSKRSRMDGERLYLMKEEHYTVISPKRVTDFKSVTKKIFKPKPFTFFNGIEILLGFMKGKVRDEVYLDWVADREREVIELRAKNYIPVPDIELVCFADKGFSKTGEMTASDIEQATSNSMYDLGVNHGRCDTIFIDQLKAESQKLMREIGLYYLNFDFFSKGDPLVIIDVWGVDSERYRQKCAVKVKVCKIEGWRLLIIRKGEDKHPAKLKQKIKDFFDNLRETEKQNIS